MFIKIKNSSTNWCDFPDTFQNINDIKEFINNNFQFKDLSIGSIKHSLRISFYCVKEKSFVYATYWKCCDVDLKND